MAFEKIVQGEDRTVEIQIFGDDGLVLDLSTVDGYTIYILDKDNKIRAKYNNPTRTDYQAIVITDSPNGKIEFRLESFTTKSIPSGEIKHELKLEFTDATFQNSTFHQTLITPFAEIIEGQTRVEDDLTP